MPDLVKKLQLKYEVLKFLRGPWLDARHTSATNKKLIRDATTDIDTFITKAAWTCTDVSLPKEIVDITWQSVFDSVAEAVFSSFDLVFTTLHDPTVLDPAVRSGASPEDMFQDGGTCKTFVEAIADAEEAVAKTSAAGGSQSDGTLPKVPEKNEQKK